MQIIERSRRAVIDTIERSANIIKDAVNRVRYSALADPQKLIWVDPAAIEKYNCLPLRKKHGAFVAGLVADGDWDENSRPINEHPVFLGLQERYVDRVPWEKTKLFHNDGYLYIKKGSPREICVRRDLLFESIKENGVVADHPASPGKQHEGVKNVIVFIGRRGEFVFSCRGWHRLCMSRFLQVEKIPVQVLMRHREWQRIREEIANPRGRLSSSARSHIDHPDMADICRRK